MCVCVCSLKPALSLEAKRGIGAGHDSLVAEYWTEGSWNGRSD